MTQKVAILATIFEQFPIVIGSLLLQRHTNWDLFLVHDGPAKHRGIDNYVNFIDDPRVHYTETEVRQQKYGHPLRREFLQNMQGRSDIDYVVITNHDNYMCPAFLDTLVSHFTPKTICTYCQHIPHNYFGWQPLQTELKLGAIDICGCMMRREAACEVGWTSNVHSADWVFLEALIKKHGKERFKQVPGALVVHN